MSSAPKRKASSKSGSAKKRAGSGRGFQQGPMYSWDGWLLTPEGAAVHEREELAVIADVHLGYEWARGEGGDCVPEHSLRETIAKLSTMLTRATIRRLVVAGDLVESHRPCPRTARDVRGLRDWLAERDVTISLVAGNHDRAWSKGTPRTFEVDGWTIAHGHEPVSAPKTITGHIHPVLRASGLTAPCFLVGQTRIVLPAFSLNAAGWNVVNAALPSALKADPLRCVAGVGMELLDFGPVAALGQALAGA